MHIEQQNRQLHDRMQQIMSRESRTRSMLPAVSQARRRSLNTVLRRQRDEQIQKENEKMLRRL